MNCGSIFASTAGSSGWNSTTRMAVPLSGGDSPIGFSAASSLNEKPGGEESVIHRLTAGLAGVERQLAVEDRDRLVVGVEPGDDAAHLRPGRDRTRCQQGDTRP